MQESLDKLNMPISLDSLNNIYKRILSDKGYSYEYTILIFKGDNIVQKLGVTSSSFFNIQTSKVPLRRDFSLLIQAQFLNPSGLFFSKMGLLLLSTTILFIFVVSCIIYQIRIIRWQDKISQIREDFSYAMIHDMKTPLSTIFMTLNSLHNGSLDNKPEMKDRYYRIAESEVSHLLTLANKVLDLSKLENHKLKMQKTQVPLAPLIDKLAEKFKAKETKPLHFTLSLGVAQVYADAEYLEEVLRNLIDNAVKYSKESVEIRITSDSDERYTLIKVYDNGLGISAADLRVIFDKYERASATKRSRKGGAAGFGLGLSFVQQVVAAHGGKVSVRSIEGEFTEFTVYLPNEIQQS